MKKTLFAVLLFIVIVLIINSIFESKRLLEKEQEQNSEKISIQLDWLHNSQFAGFYFAEKAGFYKNAGLDVTLNPGGMDFPAVQLIASNSSQFGLASADQIISAQEKNIPIVAIAIIYRKNPFVLMTLKSSNIDSVQKFIGKKIGVKYGDADESVYRAMLKNAGVNSKDLREIPVQFDKTPLFTKQVDVWPDYITGAITAEEKGFPVNIIRPSDYGINLPGSILFTTEKMIKEKPEIVKKFVLTTLEGWEAVIENQTQAISYTLQYSDELNLETETKKLKAFIPLLKPDDKPIGFMDMAMWESTQKFLLEQNFLQRSVDINKAFTAKFLQ